MNPIKEYLSKIGAKGGKRRTKAKAESARINALKASEAARKARLERKGKV